MPSYNNVDETFHCLWILRFCGNKKKKSIAEKKKKSSAALVIRSWPKVSMGLDKEGGLLCFEAFHWMYFCGTFSTNEKSPNIVKLWNSKGFEHVHYVIEEDGCVEQRLPANSFLIVTIVKISRIITVCFCNKLIIVYFITLRGRRGECNKTGVTRTQFLVINVTIASF